MIFVTVGTHEQGFSRLLKKIDDLVENGLIHEEVFIQRGYSQYIPKYSRYADFIPYRELLESIKKSRIVITHAGPGSIMDCIRDGIVPIVVPRQKQYREHVDDHQINFCKKIENKYSTIIVYDIEDLSNKIRGYDLLAETIIKKNKTYEKRELRINKSIEIIENVCNDIFKIKNNISHIAVLGTRGFPNIQGGVEQHCEKIYSLIVKYDIKVTVFARAPYFTKDKRINNYKRVKLYYVWTLRQKIYETFIHTFICLFKIRMLSIPLVHIHGIGPALLTPIARLLGFKVVLTHHGPDYKRDKWGGVSKKILKLGEYLGVKLSNCVIVVSRKIEEDLKKRFKKKSIIFIPNGVDIPYKMQPGATLRELSLKSKQYVFTACRFVQEKGLHDLVEAYKNINDPKFKLVIAGDADHESEYSRGLRKKAAQAGVILTGFISGEVLSELYSNAGLFVLPSYYEGLPIAMLEALSYGLSVLASDIPANREIGLNEERYFEAGNITELSDRMISLFEKDIEDDEKEKQLKLLNDKYNWTKIAKQTVSVYKTVLANL